MMVKTSVLIILLIGVVGSAFGQTFEGTIHWAVRFEDKRTEPTEPKSKAVTDREKAGLESLKDFFPKGITLSLKNGNARLSHHGGSLDGNVILRLLSRPDHIGFNTNSPGKAWAYAPLAPTPVFIARTRISRTEEISSLLGFPTRKYIVIVKTLPSDREMAITVWATTALTGADAKPLMHLQLSQGEVVYLPQIEGLPLKLEYRGPATEGLEFVLEVDRIDRLQLADELFRIPAGYTENPMVPQPSTVRPRAGAVP